MFVGMWVSLTAESVLLTCWPPAIGGATLDVHRGALDARLLAFLLIDNLGPVAMALGPAQVHPEQHLGPVGRLGPARSRTDREDRSALVVLAGEQERGALPV